jgi:hypothetical protein
MRMPVLLSRVTAALVALAAVSAYIPARADGIDDVYEKGIVGTANQALEHALDQAEQRRATERRQTAQPTPAPGSTPGELQWSLLPDNTVAQVPPVSQHPIRISMGQRGLDYFADLTVAHPYGDTGTFGNKWLMGGMDASLLYEFDDTTRVVASMFQIQHWPYGFNSGQVPVYLAGFRNPVGCADLTGGNKCGPGAGQNVAVGTKDTFGVFQLQKLFVFGKPDKPIPIVVSPTYVARSGVVAESGVADNDVVPFTINPPDGPVYTTVPTRSAQYEAVALTLPFMKTPKMFATFTVASQWLVHMNGANTVNHMQTPLVLYLEYTPTRGTKLFFEPQSARDYLPTDQYPEHLIAYFLGVSQRIEKYGYVQLVLNSGGSTNLGSYGIQAIKCLTTAICAPEVGGFKATQLQLQFGIGSPGYFPL